MIYIHIRITTSIASYIYTKTFIQRAAVHEKIKLAIMVEAKRINQIESMKQIKKKKNKSSI